MTLVERLLAACAGLCLVGLMGVVVVDVLLCNLFNAPLSWGSEMTELSMGAMAFAAFPLLAWRMQHVTVELLPVVPGSVTARLITIVVALATAAVFAVMAWQFEAFARRTGRSGKILAQRGPRWTWVWWAVFRFAVLTAALIALLGAVGLVLLRMPVGIALAVVGALGLYLNMGEVAARTTLGLSAQKSTMGYSQSVLPLFVLMGNLVAGAGISGHLFRTAQLFLTWRRGSLAMATIVACGACGAICGSSVATSATMARVAMPSMREYGYDDRLSSATLAAGGTPGILIPPSVVMIIYAVAKQSHICKLFAGGILPGVIGVLFYIAAIKWVVWRNRAAAPAAKAASWAEELASLRSIWPVIVLFGAVMGDIYTRFFTAIAAAGIGAFGALVFAVLGRPMSARQIWAVFVDTALVSATMFAILFGASVFVEFINLTGVHTHIRDLVTGAGIPPVVVIFIMVAICIVPGCFLETISMILITVPIFFPIVMALGYDPIWFGLLVVISAEIGLITPPIGINLFVIQSMTPGLRIQSLFAGVIPFVTVDILRITLIVLVSGIVVWLPNLLF